MLIKTINAMSTFTTTIIGERINFGKTELQVESTPFFKPCHGCHFGTELNENCPRGKKYAACFSQENINNTNIKYIKVFNY